ncbi:alpha-galactosidase [Teladorsagia circumcincta]|uniref:Alpha-galactosidase n=1 Tax=Teladorsagia circumcincta TaxID=45464 RepID=A0A2G9U929_TELCI|nr:alpha-galactosidase [Teladorsagia circumcincta]
MSNDLRVLKQEFRDILLNRDVIAVDQDPLGIMGKLVRRPVTPVHDGNSSYAVAVVNTHVHKDKYGFYKALVEDGFLAAGYNRIHIDDCWMEPHRDDFGKLKADHIRFPSGIKQLAKYMHDRKLELGIYADFGTTTCMGFPGSINHLKVDAMTFAKWNVDYLKMDGCHAELNQMVDGYARMERALNLTGRPIVFSCSYPYYFLEKGVKLDFTPTPKSCNLWRFFTDIEGSWRSIASVIHYVDDFQDMLAAVQRPGAWNDMDMIVAGLGSVTPDQARVQMTLWSMWSSPLIMSNDLRTLSPEFRKILQNRDVIAIDQDPLGIMGKLVRKNSNVRIYAKPVTPVINGLTSFAVAVVNMHESAVEEVRFTFESLGLVNIGGYYLRNLWTGLRRCEAAPKYCAKAEGLLGIVPTREFASVESR